MLNPTRLLVSKYTKYQLYLVSFIISKMDFLKANESPLISEKVDAYLALAAFLTTMIRYFCALALRLTRNNLYLCL